MLGPARGRHYTDPGVLEVEALYKRYGEVEALRGLSLRIGAGELFGLLGPNGAGKSTLVGILSGLIHADEGRIRLTPDRGPHAGQSLSPADPRSRQYLGVAPQALAIYGRMTGRENLNFFAEIYGLRGTEASSRVDWALDFVGLSSRADRQAGTYSGGMARRLNLAAALLHAPRLLVLDEPTVGVDPQSRNRLMQNVRHLQSEGVTVIYTTHYMEEASKLCTRVGIVDQGQMLAQGPVSELVRDHAGAPRLTIEDEEGKRTVAAEDPWEALKAAAETRTPKSFSVHEPTLEDVFLELTGRSLRD